MAGNLQCIGLDIDSNEELMALIDRLRPDFVRLGESAEGLSVHRWEDPSGARMVLGVRDGTMEMFLPSFASTCRTSFAGLRRLNRDVHAIDVVDDDGEQLTSMALEVEQGPLCDRTGDSGRIALVALGQNVSVHADEAAFADSDASLLVPGEEAGEPPPAFVERGMQWPVRLGAGSFISGGIFGDAEQAEAFARLSGVVVSSSRRRVVATGHDFVVARVTSAGFEADVCLSVEEHPFPPDPGAVVSGDVFLVGCLESADPLAPPRRRWFRRSR